MFLGYYKEPEATAEALQATAGCARATSARSTREGFLYDHRPQEGDHHHRRRQEHRAEEHRGRDQAVAARRRGGRDRRSPQVPHRAGHARRRAARQARAASTQIRARDPGADRPGQPDARARRAGEEVRDPARAVRHRHRRADADDEDQAQGRRAEVRARDRSDVRGRGTSGAVWPRESYVVGGGAAQIALIALSSAKLPDPLPVSRTQHGMPDEGEGAEAIALVARDRAEDPAWFAEQVVAPFAELPPRIHSSSCSRQSAGQARGRPADQTKLCPRPPRRPTSRRGRSRTAPVPPSRRRTTRRPGSVRPRGRPGARSETAQWRS